MALKRLWHSRITASSHVLSLIVNSLKPWGINFTWNKSWFNTVKHLKQTDFAYSFNVHNHQQWTRSQFFTSFWSLTCVFQMHWWGCIDASNKLTPCRAINKWDFQHCAQRVNQYGSHQLLNGKPFLSVLLDLSKDLLILQPSCLQTPHGALAIIFPDDNGHSSVNGMVLLWW